MKPINNQVSSNKQKYTPQDLMANYINKQLNP